MSFLPGTFPAGAAAVNTKLTTLAMLASATGNPLICPANVRAGDLLVHFDVGAASGVVPEGFSLIGTASGTENAIASLKIASGDEAGTEIVGIAASFAAKTMYCFRGNSPIKAVNIVDQSLVHSTGNLAPQVVNASVGAPPLLVLGFYAAGDLPTPNISPRTFTPAKDGEINDTSLTVDAWLAYRIFNSSPSDTTIDMGDEGDDNYLGSCYVECQ